jgi:hypothetical protein
MNGWKLQIYKEYVYSDSSPPNFMNGTYFYSVLYDNLFEYCIESG